MPKKTEIIKTFSGGIKNVGSGRDIKEEQSYDMVNMNPNSDSGAISLHGTGDLPFKLTTSTGGEIDAYVSDPDQDVNHLSIKPGYGLFKIDSDYSGLLNLGLNGSFSEIWKDYKYEPYSETEENATEYFFISSRKDSTDNYFPNNADVDAGDGLVGFGMFINTLQNILDGSNGTSWSDNLKTSHFVSSSNGGASTENRITHPSFFYTRGGLRIVDGNDSKAVPSAYWYIRRVNTDFGLLREKYLGHPDFPWQSGDSPYVDHWVANNLRNTFTDSYEVTPEVPTESNGLKQPEESFSHCIERSEIALDADDLNLTTSSIMNDGSVMLMINNHADNVQAEEPYMYSVPADLQLRSCKGTDIIKIQMVLSSTGEGTAGAWNFDLNTDEFYMSYYYDNGMESRLTRVRPWFGGWGKTATAGVDETTLYGALGNPDITNMPWRPQTFVDGVIQRDPAGLDSDAFLPLGPPFSSTGKASGLSVKFQAMLGNETLCIKALPLMPLGYGPGAGGSLSGQPNIWNGELSSDGLMQGKGIKGLRLYLKSLSTYTTDSKYLLCELDFEQGIRSNGTPSYSPFNTRRTHQRNGNWDDANMLDMDTEYLSGTLFEAEGVNEGHGVNEGRGKWLFAETDVLPLPVPIETYKIINTIDYDRLLIPSFKTATVLNKRAYIGNVRARGISYPDRMMKSLPKKYDSFSDQSWVDVETQDADEIINLSSFGQKILQFKRNVLHILKVEGDKETVESSFKFAGVTSPSQVCESDFGVIWANKNGLFFYNGSKLKNLLDDEGTVVLDKESWRDVISENENEQIIIGYHAPTKDVIIMRQGSDTNKQSGGFVYNLYKQNISKLEKRFADSVKSNFVNTREGELCYVDQTTRKLKKWDASPYEEKLYPGTILQTRDITFKNPSLRKTITSIYITYKSKSDSFVNIDAIIKKVDGLEETVNHVGGEENYSLPDTEDKWKTVRLRNYYDTSTAQSLSLRTKFKNVTSISLIFKRKFGTIPKEFMIDDISVVYRDKAVR